jgi:hypothetical protein
MEVELYVAISDKGGLFEVALIFSFKEWLMNTTASQLSGFRPESSSERSDARKRCKKKKEANLSIRF